VDAGIARAARGDFGPVAAEERGALFEGWIAQTLRSHQAYFGDWDDMSYWAPTEAKGVEVDFLLRSGRSFVAIEAKSGTRLRPEWFKGLQAIADLKGLKQRRMLVYQGSQSLRTEDGIEVLSVGDFLGELESRRLF
jgi:predicted AAA+ superfamily ATPase